MKKIILVGMDDVKLASIKAECPEAQYVACEDKKDTVLAHANGTHGLINCPRAEFTSGLIARLAPTLEWVHSGSAGVEDFMLPEFLVHSSVLTNGRVLQGPEIGDHALALLLSLTRCIAPLMRGGKMSDLSRPIELWGKTALVIGVGGLGANIAERAAGFGLKVYGLDHDYVPLYSFLEKLFLADELLQALPLADFVFMAAPHTHATHQWFGPEQFKAMKRGAYFVNVSRGKIVQTDALTMALQEGHLAGAGLDVTEPEPLPENHSLRKMQNVVITPHIAGLSEHNRDRSFALIKQNISRFLKGEPMLNIVNKKLGY